MMPQMYKSFRSPAYQQSPSQIRARILLGDGRWDRYRNGRGAHCQFKLYSGHLIVRIGPDIIFASFLAMRTFTGTFVPEPSRILILVKLPELGPLRASGWYVFIIFIVFVVFLPAHCNTISFVGVNHRLAWQWIVRIWQSI
jgi:hypothetical protein